MNAKADLEKVHSRLSTEHDQMNATAILEKSNSHYIHRTRTRTCSSPSVVTTGSQSNAQIGTSGRHYNNFENCWWRIQSTANQRVRLHFLRFNLEYGNSNCPYDSVNVYDGRDARAPRRGKFCGTHVPRDIISSQNAAFVSFSSDYSIVRSGFRIRYSTVSCNKLTVVTGSNGGFGTVGSPYGNYEYCTWKIQVPAGKRMRLHFTRFNLEYGRSSCPYDRVKIYDGSSVYAPLKGTYCGSRVPSDITSSGNVVFVSFTSDHSITRSGFWIQYSLLSTCSAPSVLTRPLGYFGTVGSSYRNNEQCSWTIQSQGNSKLRLHFTRFDLEYGGRSCPYDKVKVYDGSSASARLKGTFCGNTLPSDIQSSGGKMFVTFSSDYSVTRPGFRIQYSAVAGSCSRLKVLTGNSGSFGTTGSSYKNYETCSWKIQVPTLKQVLLSFVRFNLEYGRAICPYDKVKVYDGNSASAPLKGTFCGTTVPKFILSRGNTMYITFTSDYSVTASGFWIKYFAL
ncbi:Exoskeleton protein RP43 [Lamellibrachia satsuma]|nr:Exoskeleton protein RP43 [Lamellibrachia satsuma]